MIYELSNDLIRLSVNSFGAEPMSIQSVTDGLEYLWQGDAKYWARRSPTLFPIVGLLKDNQYTYQNQKYELELHGFTKTSEFELVNQTDTTLTFRLTETTDSLIKYPFKFDLYTTYQLKDNTVMVGHRVVNKNNAPMFFSIGEHPGFNCPLFEGETMEDYSLVFEKEEKINRRFLENGLLTNKEELFLNNQKDVALNTALFKDLAIILEGLQSKYVTFQSRKHSRKVTVSLEGYPYLGIWSPETGAPFVCIEPWYGISSKAGALIDLTEKEGIISLDEGKEFNCEYQITID